MTGRADSIARPHRRLSRISEHPKLSRAQDIGNQVMADFLEAGNVFYLACQSHPGPREGPDRLPGLDGRGWVPVCIATRTTSGSSGHRFARAQHGPADTDG